MAKFTDYKGGQWVLTLLNGHVAPLRKNFGIDLASGKIGESLINLMYLEAEKCEEVMWLFCREQAAERGLAREQFSFLFDAAARCRAVEALSEEIIDFFHPPKIAAEIKAQLPGMFDKMQDAAIKSLNGKIQLILNEPSGDSPESSGSTREN